MAQRKTSKKAKRMALASDTQRDVALLADSATGVGQAMLRVDKVLSQMNHRLYRHAMNYQVSFKHLVAPGTTAQHTYKFFTLPSNWFTMGAVRYAFRTWRFAIQNELGGGNPQGSWLDFRMSTANPDGDNASLNGATFDGDGYNALDAGEYNISECAIDDGTDKGFCLFGALADHFNIFNEYAKHLDSRKPDDSSITVMNTYTGLSDADDSTRESLVEKFDTPPYPQDLSGTEWADATLVLQDQVRYDGDGAQGILTTKTFDAPLGLVFVVKTVNSTDTDLSQTVPELIMRVKPGSYKGVSAQPIVRWPGDLRLASAKSNR